MSTPHYTLHTILQAIYCEALFPRVFRRFMFWYVVYVFFLKSWSFTEEKKGGVTLQDDITHCIPLSL